MPLLIPSCGVAHSSISVEELRVWAAWEATPGGGIGVGGHLALSLMDAVFLSRRHFNKRWPFTAVYSPADPVSLYFLSGAPCWFSIGLAGVMISMVPQVLGDEGDRVSLLNTASPVIDGVALLMT